MNCILLGDEIGLPALYKVIKTLGWEIKSYDVSNKSSVELEIIEPLAHLRRIHIDDEKSMINYLNQEKIDLGIVFSFNKIIKEKILKSAGFKFINVHGGKIPEYAGANALNWAIINGEKEIGITVHEITEKIDNGPILSNWNLPIIDTDDALSVRTKLVLSVEEKLPVIASQYIEKELTPSISVNKDLKLWKRRRPEDGEFDFSWTDEQIFNLVRGLVHPWPGAWFKNQDGTIKVFDRYLSLKEIADLRVRYMADGII